MALRFRTTTSVKHAAMTASLAPAAPTGLADIGRAALTVAATALAVAAGLPTK